MKNTTIDINELTIRQFIESRRPEDAEIRKQLDFGYSYDGKIALLYEIRPVWNNPNEIENIEFTKIRFYKSKRKWELYDPFPESSYLEKIIQTKKEKIMKTIHRIMTNICSEKLAESRDFYTKLFDFNVVYDSDWFVHLISKDKKLELGIIDRTHEMVPEGFQNHPQGFYVTFVVDNVDKIFRIAESEKFEIISEPTDMFYGQRRLLIKDPNGTLVDVSSPIKDFEF